VKVFQDHRAAIESTTRKRGVALESDDVLGIIRNDLEGLGYAVEKDKTLAGRIYRPVFFGEYGRPTKSYDIDAYHRDLRVGLEVEAGRGTKGYNVYRDLIQSSLLVDVDYLALAVLIEYKYGKKSVEHSYDVTHGILDAVYSSQRLKFPMKGILLIGY
jgi:hypothetical protein